MRGCAGEEQVEVYTVLRVDGDRFFYVSEDGIDVPSEGHAYDPTHGRIAVEAVAHGMVALPGREALQDIVAPVTGDERITMYEATRTAAERLLATLRRFDEEPESAGRADSSRTPDERAKAQAVYSKKVVALGDEALQRAYAASEAGLRLSDDHAGWLCALLVLADVQERAWLTSQATPAQRDLWADLTRRATPALVAGPATMLALTAYLGDDGAMANAALSRVADADPNYPIARLLAAMILGGATPDQLRQAIAEGLPC
ncbi:DUF4192 domain-containing protein [Cryptosporangium phraense]|uniref:DUF4192 domain-containing protein n=1 Tax=Cryptosporangium phraense TaxID=2593070 RepID=A0A545ANA8_9ACTN|nr:DUF4192 domain-containing protein [Cryptosporangium phraense]TQS42741.1 DUF4192 domain-containing protein [Cryptosporangium phraense]